MRDFLRSRWPLLVACLLLPLPLAAQAPAFTNISGPDFGFVGKPNVYPQSGSVFLNDATGIRTTTGQGMTLGPAGALGTLTFTFTGVPGHKWLWQLNYSNGNNLVVLKQNGTNNSVTTHYTLTNLYGPNLSPVDPTRTTADSGTFPPSGIVTVSLGEVVNLDYLQTEGSYSGVVTMSLKDMDNGLFAPARSITMKITVKAYPTITKVNDLSFGAILASSTSGSVVVPATGTASSTGNVIFLPTYSGGAIPKAAQFTVGGTTGRVVGITLPTTAVTLTEPVSGKTLTVDTFTRSPTGDVTLAATPTPVFVGATLRVGATAPAPGTYSGTFTVLCSYN